MIILKDERVIEVSEKEARMVIAAKMNRASVFISRLQLLLDTYEIRMIEPIPYQLRYGLPYVVKKDGRFLQGRYFVENGVVFSPAERGQGRVELGVYADMKNDCIREDEVVDAQGDAVRRAYPTVYPQEELQSGEDMRQLVEES
jgi:hypothetical protein